MYTDTDRFVPSVETDDFYKAMDLAKYDTKDQSMYQ